MNRILWLRSSTAPNYNVVLTCNDLFHNFPIGETVFIMPHTHVYILYTQWLIWHTCSSKGSV